MVKILHLHCRGHGFNVWMKIELRSRMPRRGVKKLINKMKESKSKVNVSPLKGKRKIFFSKMKLFHLLTGRKLKTLTTIILIF